MYKENETSSVHSIAKILNIGTRRPAVETEHLNPPADCLNKKNMTFMNVQSQPVCVMLCPESGG